MSSAIVRMMFGCLAAAFSRAPAEASPSWASIDLRVRECMFSLVIFVRSLPLSLPRAVRVTACTVALIQNAAGRIQLVQRGLQPAARSLGRGVHRILCNRQFLKWRLAHVAESPGLIQLPRLLAHIPLPRQLNE